MYYRIVKTYSYRLFCDVEADSIEEAMEKSNLEQWENFDGDEHCLESTEYASAEDYEELEDGCDLNWNEFE